MVDIEIIADPSIPGEEEQALTMAAEHGVTVAKKELTLSNKWNLSNQKLAISITSRANHAPEDPFVIAAHPQSNLIHIEVFSRHGWPHSWLTEASAKALFLAQRTSSCPPECTRKGLETVGEAMVREALLNAFMKQIGHLIDIKRNNGNSAEKAPIFMTEPDRTIWSEVAQETLAAPHYRFNGWFRHYNNGLRRHHLNGFCEGEQAKLPDISGLNLGIMFVNGYLSANNLKPSDGVDLPPKTVFSAWKRGEWRQITPN